MSYQRIFREAVGDVPPGRVDLDRIIVGQRRRVRAQRWGAAAAVAAVAAAVAAVAVGATAVGDRPRAVQPVAPSPIASSPSLPTPMWGSFTAVDYAIFDALARVAPDARWTTGRQGAWNSSAITRGSEVAGYMARGHLRVAGRGGAFIVELSPGEPLFTCAGFRPFDKGCAVRTGPDGEKIMTSSDHGVGHPSRHDAWVQRPDGMRVGVYVIGDTEQPPLTLEQVTAVALDPTVTWRAQ